MFVRGLEKSVEGGKKGRDKDLGGETAHFVGVYAHSYAIITDLILR